MFEQTFKNIDDVLWKEASCTAAAAFDRMCRKIAQDDLAKADYELLEFDRYIQSPNDAYALELRFKILLEKAFRIKSSQVEEPMR